MSTLRCLAFATLAAASACQYDVDRIYGHLAPEAGPGVDRDAGVEGQDAAIVSRSSHLIGLWGDYLTVDDECIQCAERACAQADEACRGDPECMEYTRCVAETPTPAGQSACRARHQAWVTAGNVRQRDLNGPYGQCVFRDACVAECEGSTDLGCLGQYAWPMTAGSTVPLRLILNDAQQMDMLLPGVSVKVCPEGDALCRSPAAMGTTGPGGVIDLELPTGFNRSFTGYLELQGAGIYPTLLKFSWNLGGPSVQVVSIVNTGTFMFSTIVTGVTPSPERGMLQTRMLGCSGIAVRGVSFASTAGDSQTKHWYIADGIPSLEATETNVLGAGGIFNLPPGYQTVTATRVSDGLTVARANAPVRAGFMTVVIFSPLATQ